jgi:hypothetical protein
MAAGTTAGSTNGEHLNNFDILEVDELETDTEPPAVNMSVTVDGKKTNQLKSFLHLGIRGVTIQETTSDSKQVLSALSLSFSTQDQRFFPAGSDHG